MATTEVQVQDGQAYIVHKQPVKLEDLQMQLQDVMTQIQILMSQAKQIQTIINALQENKTEAEQG